MQVAAAVRPFRLAFPAVVLLVCGGCGLLPRDDALTSDTAARAHIDDFERSHGVARASYAESASAGQNDEKPLRLGDLSSMSFSNYYKKLSGQGLDPEDAKQLYIEADTQFRQAAATEGSQRSKAFQDAAKTYQQAAKRWPDSALEQDALFMVGESYFFADYYPKANQAYETLLNKHPNSRHLDVAEARRFSMARYWLDADRTNPPSILGFNLFDKKRPSRGAFGRATKVLDKIRIDDPTGLLADDATMAAANAHFETGDFVTADDFYTDLRKTFPSSQHQFKAHLLGVKTKLESYKGPNYDSTALEQADHLLQQIRKQFRPQAREHEEYLARAERQVRYFKAEREWKSAGYYDRRGEYGGARFYYETILRDFADTPYAERARERIAEIGDRPATPPQQMSWLVNLFPESEQAKPLIIAGQQGAVH